MKNKNLVPRISVSTTGSIVSCCFSGINKTTFADIVKSFFLLTSHVDANVLTNVK